MKKMTRHQRGDALIEILVASLIFAIAVFGLVSFQASIFRDRSLVTQQMEALNAADNQLQYFRNFTVLTTSVGTNFGYASITNGSTSTAGTSATYTLNWTVSNAVNPTGKNVQIVATWNDATGTAQSVTAYGYVISLDPQDSGVVSQGLAFP